MMILRGFLIAVILWFMAVILVTSCDTAEPHNQQPQLMTTIEEIISTLIGENGLAELKGGEV